MCSPTSCALSIQVAYCFKFPFPQTLSAGRGDYWGFKSGFGLVQVTLTPNNSSSSTAIQEEEEEERKKDARHNTNAVSNVLGGEGAAEGEEGGKQRGGHQEGQGRQERDRGIGRVSSFRSEEN